MSNTQGVGNAVKQIMLAAAVNGVALKAAIYFASATINPTVGAYTAIGEATGSGYTAGGVSVTNANSAGLTTATAFWTPSAAIVYPTITIAAFDAIMIYDTGASNRNLGVFTFGSQSITAGTLTLNMPTNDATNGLIRLG